MKPTNIAYPRKHSIVANENYENYRSTSGNGTIGIYHNNNNLTISKLSIDFIMIISPAMLLAATGKNDKEKTTKMNRATVRDKIKSTLNNSLAH